MRPRNLSGSISNPPFSENKSQFLNYYLQRFIRLILVFYYKFLKSILHKNVERFVSLAHLSALFNVFIFSPSLINCNSESFSIVCNTSVP